MAECTETPNDDKTKSGGSLLSALSGLVMRPSQKRIDEIGARAEHEGICTFTDVMVLARACVYALYDDLIWYLYLKRSIQRQFESVDMDKLKQYLISEGFQEWRKGNKHIFYKGKKRWTFTERCPAA